MGGWGSFLDKLISKLPFQDRMERIKNELDNLKKEKEKLLTSEWTEKNSSRLLYINERVEYLIQLLKNNIK